MNQPIDESDAFAIMAVLGALHSGKVLMLYVGPRDFVAHIVTRATITTGKGETGEAALIDAATQLPTPTPTK